MFVSDKLHMPGLEFKSPSIPNSFHFYGKVPRIAGLGAAIAQAGAAVDHIDV